MSCGLFGITQFASARACSITAENVYGEKGRGAPGRDALEMI